MEKSPVRWRERLRRLLRSEYLPFIAFGLFMLALHLTFNTTLGDDDSYMKVLAKFMAGSGKPLFPTVRNYLVGRYLNTSDRVVIEAFLIFMVHAPLLWKLLDTLVWVLFARLFSRFFNQERRAALDWFIVYALLTFPLRLMRTAGWITTSMNYTWPLALCMFALTPLVNAIQRRPTKRWVYVLSALAMPYAVNHEQVCCMMLAVCGFLTVELYLRDRKLSKFAVFELAFSLAMLAFMLACPGNDARNAMETERWFPEFANLSFWQKAELGYSSTLYKCVMEPNLVFSLLAMTLALTVFLYDARPWARLIAAVPLAATLVLGTFGELAEQVIPYLADLRNRMTDSGTLFQLTKFRTWPPDAFITLVLLCLLATLWLAFRERRDVLFAIYLTLAGLASRMVMGFSPTVWASRERTFTVMYFAMLAVAILAVRRLLRHPRNGRYLKLLRAGIAVHCVFILEEYMYYLTKI